MKLTTVITSLSNFSVQYNFNSIPIALIVMSVSVCSSTPSNCLLGQQASWVYVSSTALTFVGSIIGQLSMGYIGDVIGRSRGLLLTMAIAALSALLSGAAPSGSPDAIYAVIIVFRFFIGMPLLLIIFTFKSCSDIEFDILNFRCGCGRSIPTERY